MPPYGQRAALCAPSNEATDRLYTRNVHVGRIEKVDSPPSAHQLYCIIVIDKRELGLDNEAQAGGGGGKKA